MALINLPAFSNDLLSLFEKLKTERVDTPVIQPAEPFLDIAGEDLRRRIFMTESETGASLCLRPEFTIPVCLRHLETATGTPKRYAYLGEVFRQRREGSNEFYQAGIEDLGEGDIASADARAIADADRILKALLPGSSLAVVIGDQAVFEAVVQALGLPGGWQKRLVQAFGDMQQLDGLLKKLAQPETVGGLGADVAAMLAAGNDEELVAHIDRTMQETGYSTNASRAPADIARRLKEKLSLAETHLSDQQIGILKTFLRLDVSLAEASTALSQFAAATGLKIDAALNHFDRRIAALANAGMDLGAIRYKAAFGRPLDYYTGLVFEISVAGSDAVLAGGGRFDRLLTLLGAKDRIPAVGFSLWLDRIEAAKPSGAGQ
ncbi:ATP phosphoribosyltransferase regulatory subunit [Rhizobium sp. NRK18]|uniref:ATP phosphoribosyltransferase regulatory subunit n=1 Tax=Rhizobium sp. NRK18 TaxID=2964667 RepID=UPI0021C26DC8|nr:ATP phosphoribosyltransferase regulatory subunit [Rhizobium sp. NRK18]MCQ2005207.1 ATP phosphoribosyltransferase regulatory subunit [Rhizobium sp. NRK18]